MSYYLLDANTFIEAKNRYYSMTICPGFWQWITNSNKAKQIESISFVADELKKGNDKLAEWAKENPQIFDTCDDEATQNAYIKVANLVMSLEGFKPNAKDEFLIGADPWLIAKSIVLNATLVTHEKYNPDIKRKILIPNICQYFKVPYLNTFELLEKLEAKFVLA